MGILRSALAQLSTGAPATPLSDPSHQKDAPSASLRRVEAARQSSAQQVLDVCPDLAVSWLPPVSGISEDTPEARRIAAVHRDPAARA